MNARKVALISILALAGATLMCGKHGDPPKSTVMSAFPTTQPAGRPADNRLCLVCHELLADELISHAHEVKNILCIDCHGQSSLHMEDEMLMTRPDILYGRNEVEPFCKACHTAHKDPEKVDAFLAEWRGRDRPNGRLITSSSICTDCHGTHNLHKADAGKKAASAPAEDQGEWIPLFNGKDLTGWQPVGNAKWTVEAGSLIGTQGDGNAPGDLLTEATYKDFLLTATYQVEWPCNSGIWFRYQSAGKAYQADILEYPDPKCYSGTLYCTGKRFIAMNTDASLVDREGWNTISVRAEGRHVQVWLNGKQTADVQDDTSDSGRIGFQVHPGAQFAKMKIIVREIQIQPLGNRR
jgi:hypothetical protein